MCSLQAHPCQSKAKGFHLLPCKHDRLVSSRSEYEHNAFAVRTVPRHAHGDETAVCRIAWSEACLLWCRASVLGKVSREARFGRHRGRNTVLSQLATRSQSHPTRRECNVNQPGERLHVACNSTASCERQRHRVPYTATVQLKY